MTVISNTDTIKIYTTDRLPDQKRATESLEQELKELSERIATDPVRFQEVREELRRRRETRDEQPLPLTAEQRAEQEQLAQRQVDNALTNKLIAMEAEQAKLVVEAEIAKAAQREAEDRLALLARHPRPRAPLTEDAARELAVRHMRDLHGVDADVADPADWTIRAIIEASR